MKKKNDMMERSRGKESRGCRKRRRVRGSENTRQNTIDRERGREGQQEKDIATECREGGVNMESVGVPVQLEFSPRSYSNRCRATNL